MRSLLIVIKEEQFSKGLALAFMDHFQSIHTTKNPYEAVELLRKEKIDTVITEVNFNTIAANSYIKGIINEMKSQCNLIVIEDAPFEIEEFGSNQNIIVQQKPISIKTMISIINSIEENSTEKNKEEN